MTSTLVKDKIESLFDLRSKPIIVKKDWTFIFKESGIRIPIHLVLSNMKEEIILSYKTGKSRPALYDLDKNLLLKYYFTIKMIKLLPFIDIIVRIDEEWFFRTSAA